MRFGIALLLAGAASLLIHSLARYRVSKVNSVLAFLFAGGASGITLILYLGITYGWFTLPVFAGGLLFALFCELYIFLFTLVIGSVSAALLIEISSNSVPHAEPQFLSPKTMLAARLLALSRLGLILRKGDCCIITSKGRLLVRIGRSLRRFFGHDVGRRYVER